MSKEQAWQQWWLNFAYFPIGRDELKEAFEAGYDSARAQAVSAVCYMCANPEYYGPPEKIEGSARLWHYQLSDGWLHGECLARPILELIS